MVKWLANFYQCYVNNTKSSQFKILQASFQYRSMKIQIYNLQMNKVHLKCELRCIGWFTSSTECDLFTFSFNRNDVCTEIRRKIIVAGEMNENLRLRRIYAWFSMQKNASLQGWRKKEREKDCESEDKHCTKIR